MNLSHAQKLLDKGKLAEAEQALRVREHAAYDPRRSFILAKIRQAEGDEQSALREFEDAEKRAPAHAPAHLLHGIALYDTSDFVYAETDFRRVLELQPQNDLAYAYLALTQLAQGRDEEGLAIFCQHGFNDNRWFMVRLTEWVERQWLENGRFFAPKPVIIPEPEAPGDVSFFTVRKREKHGQRSFFAKRYDEMLTHLAPLAAAADADEEVLFACALGCEMLGDYAQALEYLARLSPEDVLPDAARAARARCMVRLGRFEEAALDMNKVLMIGPEDYGMNYYLGVLCLSYGERQRARQLFYRAYSDYLVDSLEYQFWQIQRALLA